MARQYIGITIGPIFDTMSMSSSPVALWAASYMFSALSKTLCRLITEAGVGEEDIISPYYAKDDVLLDKNNGVGLFHDRIIFRAENFDTKKLVSIKAAAISEISEMFGIGREYLESYLMIYDAVFDAENPIMDSSHILDCLELSKAFVAADETCSLQVLFNGDRYSRNSYLSKTKAVRDIDGFKLKKDDGTFKNIEELLNEDKKYKKHRYYAIVRSDGDNMSKIISSLKNDTDIRDFSKACLEYCDEVAEKVSEYNGIPVYSGGDDLLAILPCESPSGKTPFEFAVEANEIFDKCFSKYEKPTSLSFGMTMVYYKFPLFEALEDSQKLLFDIAKNGDKNRVAVRLQKNAGQSEGLVISNGELESFIKLLNVIKSECSSEEGIEEVILSVIHKFSLFERLFDNMDDSQQVTNMVENVFDADIHKSSMFISYRLIDFINELKEKNGIFALSDEGILDNKISTTMNYILRIAKFFTEKGGDE